MRAVQNAPGTHGGAGLPWPGESLGCWQEEKPPDFEAWTECGEEEGKGSQKCKARESRAECAREREEAGSATSLPWEVGDIWNLSGITRVGSSKYFE